MVYSIGSLFSGRKPGWGMGGGGGALLSGGPLLSELLERSEN